MLREDSGRGFFHSRFRVSRKSDLDIFSSMAEPERLRLMIRSREAGVEVVSGPRRNEGDEPLNLEIEGNGFEGRSLVNLSPDGQWIGVNGGGKGLECVGRERKFVLPAKETADVERFSFSPLGTFLVTWQRPDSERFPEGSLRAWSLSQDEDNRLVRCFHCKQLKKGGIDSTLAWSGDERIAMHAVTNAARIVDGDLPKSVEFRDTIRCEGMNQFAISPCPEPPYAAALVVPELKGKPASVRVVSYPRGDVVCQKAFYRAEDVDLKWSPSGDGVLVQTSTAVDATGGSYYGGSGLYLLHARSSKECQVPLPKDGPIADAQWEPSKGREFVVISGTVPPVAALFNLDAEQLYSFGAAHRNTISWSPHGRFLALCGFGNMAGGVDFWDRLRKKKIGSTTIPTAVTHGWSADSRTFMTATLAPRMNVDNGVRIYRYDGSGPIAVLTNRQPLFECRWIPTSSSQFPDRPASPASKARSKLNKSDESAKPKAYVPPSARGSGSSSLAAAAMRAELDAENKKNAASGSNRKSSTTTATIPGMAPETSRNKKRKENQRKRKEAAEAAAELNQPPPAPPQAAEEVAVEEPPLTKELALKKQKALKKKLKLVAELKAKVDAGQVQPTEDQREKLNRAEGLEAELAALEEQLESL